jgi:6-phosphogluconolactonase (cycloisomerase 2 family)
MQGLPGITKLLVTVLALAAALANATPHGYVGVLRDDVGGVSLAGPHGLAITSDGAHVYVAAQVGAIAIFSPDPLTGALGFVGELADGNLLAGVYDLAVSADGAHVYAAVLGVGGGVRIYSRDAGTGLLTSAGTIGSFDAFAIAISPDDEHVYVCDRTGDSLVAYDRNTTTGALTFVEGETDGVGGVDGLDGARDVVVSPDGDHVYATGFNDDAVAVFSRDGTTGALTFVEVERDGVGGVDGLFGAHGLDISPDGAHIYVAGEFGLAAFARDAGTGALTFVEYDDHQGALNSLKGASSAARRSSSTSCRSSGGGCRPSRSPTTPGPGSGSTSFPRGLARRTGRTGRSPARRRTASASSAT